MMVMIMLWAHRDSFIMLRDSGFMLRDSGFGLDTLTAAAYPWDISCRFSVSHFVRVSHFHSCSVLHSCSCFQTPKPDP